MFEVPLPPIGVPFRRRKRRLQPLPLLTLPQRQRLEPSLTLDQLPNLLGDGQTQFLMSVGRQMDAIGTVGRDDLRCVGFSATTPGQRTFLASRTVGSSSFRGVHPQELESPKIKILFGLSPVTRLFYFRSDRFEIGISFG